MDSNHVILGVYANAFTTIVKKHEPTNLVMDMIRNRMVTFTELLKVKVEGVDIIQAGSSFDELHMTRVLDKREGEQKFFPDIDFDFDLVYTGYVVEDVTTTTDGKIPEDDNVENGHAVIESNSALMSSNTEDTPGGSIARNKNDEVGQGELSLLTNTNRPKIHSVTTSKMATEEPKGKQLDNHSAAGINSMGSLKAEEQVTKSHNVSVTGVMSSNSSSRSVESKQECFGRMVQTENPGYVKLFITKTGRAMLQRPSCRIGCFVNKEGYLSNTAFSSNIITKHDTEKADEVIYSRTDQEYILSGPAITDIHPEKKGFTYDFVHAFPCNTWPSCAKGWMDRARSCHWPNESVIDSVTKDGCLLVPVGSHLSSEKSLEWRVSFVKSERILSKSLNNLQRTCYSVVKLMLKSLLSETSILTSYQMKNIFYYTCEEVGGDEKWTEENLGEMMIKFLKYIATALHIHRIPHYFLPPNNLISHCSPEEVQATKKEVEHILNNPFTALMEACRKMECFDDSSASEKFKHWKGELKPMLVIYTSFVQILWNLGLINIGTNFSLDCFQKVVRMNQVSSTLVKAGSGIFTSTSVPELLQPLAISNMQQGDIDGALSLFLAAKESNEALVEKAFPNILTNIACLLSLKSSQHTSSKDTKRRYQKQAKEYFEKAMKFITNSPSLHLSYGNFLLDSRKSFSNAASQFQTAINIVSPRKDDDALVQIDIPGSTRFPSRKCYVPGMLAAYFLLVVCYIQMDDIAKSRQIARRFELFLETCELKHKAVGYQLCSASYNAVGLIVKSALLSEEACRYDFVNRRA